MFSSQSRFNDANDTSLHWQCLVKGLYMGWLHTRIRQHEGVIDLQQELSCSCNNSIKAELLESPVVVVVLHINNHSNSWLAVPRLRFTRGLPKPTAQP